MALICWRPIRQNEPVAPATGTGAGQGGGRTTGVKQEAMRTRVTVASGETGNHAVSPPAGRPDRQMVYNRH